MSATLGSTSSLKTRNVNARWAEQTLRAIIVLGVVWFYLWTVKTTQIELSAAHGDEVDYYNRLSRGFLDGRLSLKLDVPRALVEAEDPYDPAKRPPGVAPHDISYYRGHYYLYFGVTPVISLLLPFRLLIGSDLPMYYGNWLFVSIGFILNVQLWREIQRRYFADSNTLLGVATILVLGLCGMTLSLLRRPSIWELPIAAGYMQCSLGIFALYKGLHCSRSRGWLMICGLALGLATGARPNLAIPSAALIGLSAFAILRANSIGRPSGERESFSSRCIDLVALCGSFAAVVGGLLWHNYARFENPFEFGLSYQLTGNVESRVKHFSFSFIPFNAQLYFLSPAQWSRYFPFVQPIETRPAPSGYYGYEFPYGLFANLPISLLALWLLLRAPQRHVVASPFRIWLGGLGAFFVVSCILVCGFVTGAQRYMADFAPWLILLSAIGALALEHEARAWRKMARYGIQTAVLTAAALSAFVGMMISFQLHQIFRLNSPESYNRWAQVANAPVTWVERWAGTVHGPLEIRLRFPVQKTSRIEPLLCTGWAFYSDTVFVEYTGADSLRFGFAHPGQDAVYSENTAIDWTAEHTLRLEMGSLYPPDGYTGFRRLSRSQREAQTHRLRIELDGKTLLDVRQEFFDGSPGSTKLGRAVASPAYGDHFTGSFISMTRIARSAWAIPGLHKGPIDMELIFPRDAAGRSEPVIAFGRSGRADTLFVQYLDNQKVRFGYDHWGVSAEFSGEIALSPASLHRLEVSLPSLSRDPQISREQKGELLLVLDNRIVWKSSVAAYSSEDYNMRIGENSAEASVCEPRFTGLVTAVRQSIDLPVFSAGEPLQIPLRIAFPIHPEAEAEPLIVAGERGAADCLFVHYIDAKHVRFGFDHWGAPTRWSHAIEIERENTHDLEWALSPSVTDAGHTEAVLQIDGAVAWRTPVEKFTTAAKISLGENTVEVTTCAKKFSGVVWLPYRSERTAQHF